MKNKIQKMTYWLQVISIGLVLGLGLQITLAWTEPTQVPPGGNLGAPINTSNTSQTKSGGLTSSSFFNISSWDSQYRADNKRAIGGARGWNPNMLYINGFGDWTSGSHFGGSRVLANGYFHSLGGGAYNAGAMIMGTHSLNSHWNGWLYLGDQNFGVYGGRGLAADYFWTSTRSYLHYARGCSKLYTNNNGEILCGADQTGIGSESDTLNSVSHRGNWTDQQITINAWNSQYRADNKRAIGGARGWNPNMLYINGFGDWTSGTQVRGPLLYVEGNLYLNNPRNCSGKLYTDGNGLVRCGAGISVTGYYTVSGDGAQSVDMGHHRVCFLTTVKGVSPGVIPKIGCQISGNILWVQSGAPAHTWCQARCLDW